MDMQTKAAQATRNRRGVMMLPLLAAVAVAAITIIPVVRWCMAFINGTENINAQLEMQSIIQEYYSKVSAASYEELQATIASKGTTWTEDVGGKYTLTIETSEAGKFENALCNLDEAAGAYDRACMKANITLVSKADPSRTVGMQVTRVATLNQLAELADKIEAEGERFADYYTKAEADAQYACPWNYKLVSEKCVYCAKPSGMKQYRDANCNLKTCGTNKKANANKDGCVACPEPTGNQYRSGDCTLATCPEGETPNESKTGCDSAREYFVAYQCATIYNPNHFQFEHWFYYKYHMIYPIYRDDFKDDEGNSIIDETGKWTGECLTYQDDGGSGTGYECRRTTKLSPSESFLSGKVEKAQFCLFKVYKDRSISEFDYRRNRVNQWALAFISNTDSAPSAHYTYSSETNKYWISSYPTNPTKGFDSFVRIMSWTTDGYSPVDMNEGLDNIGGFTYRMIIKGCNKDVVIQMPKKVVIDPQGYGYGSCTRDPDYSPSNDSYSWMCSSSLYGVTCDTGSTGNWLCYSKNEGKTCKGPWTCNSGSYGIYCNFGGRNGQGWMCTDTTIGQKCSP